MDKRAVRGSPRAIPATPHAAQGPPDQGQAHVATAQVEARHPGDDVVHPGQHARPGVRGHLPVAEQGEAADPLPVQAGFRLLQAGRGSGQSGLRGRWTLQPTRRVDSLGECQPCAQTQDCVPKPRASPSSRRALGPRHSSRTAATPGSTPPVSTPMAHLLLQARGWGQGLPSNTEQLNASPRPGAQGRKRGQVTHSPLTVSPAGGSGPQAHARQGSRPRSQMTLSRPQPLLSPFALATWLSGDRKLVLPR